MATEKEALSADLLTPLQAYAHQANELYVAFKQAGFEEEEAWALLLNHLPQFEIPIYGDFADMEDMVNELIEEEEDGEDN
jgi:hypothetical protein